MPNTGLDWKKSVEQGERGSEVVSTEVLEQVTDSADKAMEAVKWNNMLDEYNDEELGLLFEEVWFINEVIQEWSDKDVLRLITNPGWDYVSYICLSEERWTKEMYELVIKEELWLSRVLFAPLVKFCGNEWIRYIQDYVAELEES